jgi:hypothetical protein
MIRHTHHWQPSALLLKIDLRASTQLTSSALSCPSLPPGKFYTLVTGANERRWGKMSSKITTVAKSFDVEDRF